ncbi:hypothetical protein EUTSA_v10020550mg [Eutrema salsugineum]|uniref:Uncharacterized protein n=1 Tax=Eutrema salsugineum TaxID=72664 RepID=V4M2Z2_EUTSA|nr:uncharacterized protein LOC18024720 [Eutrema salsugineum]ESQ49257.1 hypothetical protein EUTSA_v10020550mg [Eutrema salsugineum]
MNIDDGCTRFMVNAVSEPTSTMHEEIDVPIICRDDDLEIDNSYKLFLDHISNGTSLGTPFEADNGEYEKRKFRTFSCGNEKPIDNRVSQQRKRKAFGFEAENSRAVPLATTLEGILRDNRLAERRKRKNAELEAARVSWAVPLVRNHQVNINQTHTKARKMSESKVETSSDSPLFRTKEDIRREYKAKNMSASKVDTLWDVPLVRSKVVIRRDNRIAKLRKKKIDETKASGTSRAVPVECINTVTERNKAVDETSRFVPVTQSKKEVFVGTRKKKEDESVAVVDKDYMSYLTWLVGSLKDSTTEPDSSAFDPPISDTQKESTIVPDKVPLAKVKVELDHESWSDDDDDDDMIEVSDSPFSDGQGTPFVVSKSKNMIDLEEESAEDESSSSCFKEKLMDVLEKPYDEEELLRLSREVSVKKPVTRCRELRKGRESNYKTDELGHSYLEKVPDFDKEYKRVDGDDKASLELLRGFFFYLENISLGGAFKPWLPENKKKLGHKKKQCLQP